MQVDPGAIALTVAGLLAKTALEALGGKAGESTWGAFGRIADAVRARFGNEAEVTEALERLEAKPTSQARTTEVAEVLQPRLEADPDFAAELARLIEQARIEPQTASFVTTVQDNARVGRLTNIGQVAGDVHF
jgi:hypothetical protein